MCKRNCFVQSSLYGEITMPQKTLDAQAARAFRVLEWGDEQPEIQPF